MSFAKLKELIGDNAEAISLIDSLEKQSTENVSTINNLEKSISEIKDTRDKYKSGNTLVKSLLGLEHINEESLNDYLSKSKSNKGDEKSILEIENLKKELASANDKLNSTVSTYNSQIQELKLGTQLQDLIAGTSILPEARGDALQIVKSMMKFNENNEPVFLNEDGTTKYHNGKPFGLADAVSSLQETRPYMFSRDTKSGGGTQPNNGSTTAGKLGGTPEEERAYIQAKYGNKN